MNTKTLIKVSLVTLIILSVAVVASQSVENTLLQAMRAITTVGLIVYLAGANCTRSIEIITRRRFSAPVFHTLALATSLFILPPLHLLVNLYLGHIDIATTASLYTLPIAAVILLTITKKKSISVSQPDQPIALPVPLLLTVLVVIGAHLFSMFRSPALLGLDAYSWVIHFESVVATNQIDTTIERARWAYTSFFSSLHYVSSLSIFTIAKYIVPLLPVSVLLPLWLIARQQSSITIKSTILLSAIASPAVFLEFNTPRQQGLVLIFIYFLIGLLYEAKRVNNYFLYNFCGVITITGSFIHPAFTLVLPAWVTGLTVMHWPTIRSHKKTVAVALALSIPLLQKLDIFNMLSRVKDQALEVLKNISDRNQNWHFPAQYINSDAIEIGWPGITGIIKYYAFNAGPFSLVLLGTLAATFAVSRNVRHQITTQIKNPYVIPLVLLFLLFLVIAEIAPRIANIAYLPDRAWQFLAILVIPLLLIIAPFLQRKWRFSNHLILFTITTTITLAVYTNHLMNYAITHEELEAARWLQENTSATATVAANSSKNVIRYHSNRRYSALHPDFYDQSFDNILYALANTNNIRTKAPNAINHISQLSTEIIRRAKEIDQATFNSRKSRTTIIDEIHILENQQRELADLSRRMEELVDQAYTEHDASIKSEPAREDLYLFFAATHPKNPFQDRPYKSSFTGTRSIEQLGFIVENPEIFKKVYDNEKRVIIWQVHLPI